MATNDGWTTVSYKKDPKPQMLKRISASHLETEKMKQQGYIPGEALKSSPRYDHQDWGPVILRSKSNPAVAKATAKAPAPKKSQSSTLVSIKKLENENSEESMKIPKVDIDTGKKIQQMRNQMNLTQEQLAQKFGGRFGITKETIRDIENGTAVYRGEQLAKIKQFLKI